MNNKNIMQNERKLKLKSVYCDSISMKYIIYNVYWEKKTRRVIAEDSEGGARVLYFESCPR
jgi:hypothetical protein